MRFALDIGPGRLSEEATASLPSDRLIWACRDLARADAGQVQAGITTPTAQAALADEIAGQMEALAAQAGACLLYTSPSPRDRQKSRMPSSA